MVATAQLPSPRGGTRGSPVPAHNNQQTLVRSRHARATAAVIHGQITYAAEKNGNEFDSLVNTSFR